MDLRKRIFKRFALALFGLFVVNTVANLFYLYQNFSWFDQMMHFFGGAIGGLFLIWFFFSKYQDFFVKKKFWKIVLINSLVFLFVALVWEVMEFSVQDWFGIGHVLAEKKDSVNDLLMGLLGNGVALLYYFSRIRGEYVRSI